MSAFELMKLETLGATQCNPVLRILSLIITAINIILYFTSLYFTLQFIQYERSKPVHKKTPKLSYYSGVTFCIISSFTLLSWGLMPIDICWIFVYTQWGVYIFRITKWFYLLQLYCLWLTLFIKLYYVFKDSIYSLSSCTIRLFITFFIFSPITMWIILNLSISFSEDGRTGWIAFLSFAIFSVLLSYLFIHKLFKLFRDTQKLNPISKMNPKNNILSTMTRTTILAIISLILSILSPVILYVYYPSMHYNFLSLINYQLPMMDIYTNFICVILTYGPFTKHYVVLCGICDLQCKKCLFKMISKSAMPPQLRPRAWTLASMSSMASIGDHRQEEEEKTDMLDM